MSGSRHDLPSDTGQPRYIKDEVSAVTGGNTERDETSDGASQAPCRREQGIWLATQAVQETPDIREDRVAAAKRALTSGRLHLRGEDLADRLLGDDLHHADLDA